IGYVVRRSPERVREDTYFGEIIAGVQPTLAQRLYGLLVSVVTTETEERQVYDRLIAQRLVDGFLLIDHRTRDWRYNRLFASNVGAVCIGDPPADQPFSVVRPREAVVDEAVELLVRYGHSEIAFVEGSREFS